MRECERDWCGAEEHVKIWIVLMLCEWIIKWVRIREIIDRGCGGDACCGESGAGKV